MTERLKIAQEKLNGTILTNPYVLFTAAVVALGVAMGKVADRVYNAEKYAKKALDESADKVDEVRSEIDSLNSELKTTQDRIDELNSKENLTLVEQDELNRLKETNDELERELRLKQSILSKEEKEANKDAKKYFTTKKDSLNFETSYEGVEIHEETDYIGTVEERIDRLQQYAEGKIQLSEETIASYKDYVESAISDFMQEDDYLVKGLDDGVLDRLDALYEKYDIYTNGRGSVVEEKISGILAKVDFQNEAKQLEELGKDGSLSIDALASRFPDLIKYLNDAGVSAEELYQYIMALSNPDAINYQEVEKQFLEQLGIRDGVVRGASDQKIYDEVKSLGLLENESLEAYLTVKTKFTDGQTTEWSPKDWADYIQKEINGELASDEMSDLSPTITSSISQIATQLEPQFAKLGEAYKAIFTDNGFTLDDVDNSMLEGLRKSFAEIEEEVGVTFDSSKLNSFFDALTNGNSSAEQVQQAFNDLATAYFYSTDTLAQLNEETAASIEKQLEELGVVNAKEVVYGNLIAQEEFLAQTGISLADASNDKVMAFLNEAGASETTRQCIYALKFAEIAFNENSVNVKGKVESLTELARAYGDTTTAALGAAAASKVQNGEGDYNTILNEMVENFNASFGKLEIDFKGINNSASKAGSSTGDAYVEAYEKELEALGKLRDRGEISEAEYLSRMKALYEKYFKGISKYQDKYFEEQGKYLSGMLDLYNSALSGISKLLGNKIDAVQEEKDATISALEEERDARLEVIEAQKEQLQAEIDLIDEQIEKKQEIIDSINDEINKMREAADQRKRNLDLQKAQYELEKMQHQRTKLVNICQTL